MSRIQREWACAAHGEFTNSSGRCPHGCSKRFVVQEFRTAPAVSTGGRTRMVDQQLRGLAGDFGLSDIKNGQDGESVMQTLRQKPQTAPTWGNVEHAAPGFSRDPNIARPKYATGYPGAGVEQFKSVFTPISQMTHIAARDHSKVPT